jgi:hypothetical protein
MSGKKSGEVCCVMKRLGIKHINTKCKPYLGPNFKKLLKDQ